MYHLNEKSTQYHAVTWENRVTFAYGSDGLGLQQLYSPDAPCTQWLFLVPVKGGIGSIFDPPEGKDYKWYISGIYCQLGDYMQPTTF